MDTIREKLASLQHDIWAHWMKYLFSQCVVDKWTGDEYSGFEGKWIVPHDQVVKWHRQIETPYDELSEKEKESDRHQADKVLKLLQKNGKNDSKGK